MKIRDLIVIILLSGKLSFAGRVDSLESICHTAKLDTATAFAFASLGDEYYWMGDSRAEDTYLKAYEWAKRTGHFRSAISALKGIGNILADKGQYAKAIRYYEAGMIIAGRSADSLSYATLLNNIGLTYFDRGEYSKAMDTYIKTLGIAERHKYVKILGLSSGNISLVYYRQKNYKRALEFAEKSIHFREESGNLAALSNAHNNLGIIYEDMGDLNKAKREYRIAFSIAHNAGNKLNISAFLDNLSNVFLKEKLLDSARYYNEWAFKVREELGDSLGLTNSLINSAAILIDLKKFDEAAKMIDRALILSKSLGLKMQEKECYHSYSIIYTSQQKFKEANEMLTQYMNLKDSIQGTEVSSRIAQMESVYELDKKEGENKLLRNEAELKDAKIKEETMFRYFLFGVVGLAIVLIIVGYVAYRNKKRDNRLLSQQKDLIEGQKKEITDSINYAKRIQSAILPDKQDLQTIFPEHFVLYRPKDIVSGDFYYWHRTNTGFYLACVDCTGHGVPGALMSMVGKEKLAAAIEQVSEPGAILSQLNRSVKSALRQGSGEDASRDGMDISVIRFDRGSLYFSGANRPLWIFSKGEMLDFKPTKAAIGGLTPDEQTFENHAVQVEKGDMVYLFTDGFADQFGGKDSKKMTTRHFRKLLIEIAAQPAPKQGEILQRTFSEWKGDLEQIDDVLVIGFRI